MRILPMRKKAIAASLVITACLTLAACAGKDRLGSYETPPSDTVSYTEESAVTENPDSSAAADSAADETLSETEKTKDAEETAEVRAVGGPPPLMYEYNGTKYYWSYEYLGAGFIEKSSGEYIILGEDDPEITSQFKIIETFLGIDWNDYTHIITRNIPSGIEDLYLGSDNNILCIIDVTARSDDYSCNPNFEYFEDGDRIIDVSMWCPGDYD